ncbi:acid-sensing ion channel 5 [Brachionus plicatilis]|uniref:Acid-sensing ion channel 5 n=1 Tax=Brachionus plicatilis TaxID=10195 RepID=A0A3M7QPU7_BRAPC|nr:acid-sensing ion channel 5 [Brachionus plicatilis]
MKNEKKTASEFFDKIILWASSTSAHGVKNVFQSDLLLKKIMWSVILVSSVSYCFYQVVLVVTLFFRFNVITSLKAVYEAPTSYPAVAFCNLNAYNGPFVRDNMKEILEKKNISQDNYEPIDFVDNGVDHFKSTFEIEALKGQFNLHFSGFYLYEMLISCRSHKKKVTMIYQFTKLKKLSRNFINEFSIKIIRRNYSFVELIWLKLMSALPFLVKILQ